jgi:hypothetical protein
MGSLICLVGQSLIGLGSQMAIWAKCFKYGTTFNRHLCWFGFIYCNGLLIIHRKPFKCIKRKTQIILVAV